MAPSANRRSGFSRRAQYTTFFAYLAGVLGALAGGALLIVSIDSPAAFSGLRGTAADAAAPAGNVAAGARSASNGFISTIEDYFFAADKNAKLRRELAAAKIRLVEAQAIAEENRRLKALLQLAGEDSKPVVHTRMASSSASSTRRFAIIAAGARDGVEIGMPVRAPSGLIGRVLEVGAISSRVLLLTDTASVVPARRAQDGLPVFVEGRGDGTVQLRLINLGINPVRKGDVFVTSGSGGLYQPGMAIAVAARLTRDGAIGHVLSDPAASEYVSVERVWNPAATTALVADAPQTGQPADGQAR
jgi:rod shape-determining protein MreC